MNTHGTFLEEVLASVFPICRDDAKGNEQRYET
jgi:hypothetical protein